MFDKVMEMVDDVETSVPYVIFVLVHPKDYKAAVKDAGNISVTVADSLRLVHKPLIAVRNDLFIKPFIEGSDYYEQRNKKYNDQRRN